MFARLLAIAETPGRRRAGEFRLPGQRLVNGAIDFEVLRCRRLASGCREPDRCRAPRGTRSRRCFKAALSSTSIAAALTSTNGLVSASRTTTFVCSVHSPSIWDLTWFCIREHQAGLDLGRRPASGRVGDCNSADRHQPTGRGWRPPIPVAGKCVEEQHPEHSAIAAIAAAKSACAAAPASTNTAQVCPATGEQHGTAAPIGPLGQRGLAFAATAAVAHAVQANSRWLADLNSGSAAAEFSPASQPTRVSGPSTTTPTARP